MSKEYTSALAILLVTVLKMFGIEISNETITSLLVSGLAIYVAFRRHQRGDINAFGGKK